MNSRRLLLVCLVPLCVAFAAVAQTNVNCPECLRKDAAQAALERAKCSLNADRIFTDEKGDPFFYPPLEFPQLQVNGELKGPSYEFEGRFEARMQPTAESRKKFRELRKKYPGLKWYSERKGVSVTLATIGETALEVQPGRHGELSIRRPLNEMQVTLLGEGMKNLKWIAVQVRPSPDCPPIVGEAAATTETSLRLAVVDKQLSCLQTGDREKVEAIQAEYAAAKTIEAKRAAAKRLVEHLFSAKDGRLGKLSDATGLSKKQLRAFALNWIDDPEVRIPYWCSGCTSLDPQLDHFVEGWGVRDNGPYHQLFETIQMFYRKLLGTEDGATSHFANERHAEWQEKILEKCCERSPYGEDYQMKGYSYEPAKYDAKRIEPAVAAVKKRLAGMESREREILFCDDAPRSQVVRESATFPLQSKEWIEEIRREKLKGGKSKVEKVERVEPLKPETKPELKPEPKTEPKKEPAAVKPLAV